MIKCKILCRDHTTQIKMVNSKKEWFEFHDGWYNLDRRFGLHEKDHTTYFYLEGNSQPLNCKEDTMRFLETIGFKSLMAQFKGSSLLAPWGETLLEYVRNPQKILGLGLTLIILYLVTQAILGGL